MSWFGPKHPPDGFAESTAKLRLLKMQSGGVSVFVIGRSSRSDKMLNFCVICIRSLTSSDALIGAILSRRVGRCSRTAPRFAPLSTAANRNNQSSETQSQFLTRVSGVLIEGFRSKAGNGTH